MQDVEDIFEDNMDILEIINFGFPRQVYERNNPFENLSELAFFKRFSLYKDTCQHVLEMIEEELEPPSDLNNAVSPMNQLTALRLYATGGHLSSVADVMKMDVSTVSRIVVRVSEAIARLSPHVIKMPERNNIIKEQTKFYQLARFPKVIGAIDGTHIRIQSPGGLDAEIFRNRKSYFSINTQVVCNANVFNFLRIIKFENILHFIHSFIINCPIILYIITVKWICKAIHCLFIH